MNRQPRHRLSREGVARLPTGSPAEILLAEQLRQAGLPSWHERYAGWEREVTFCDRKWRFDFAWTAQRLAVEIEGGSYTGGHKRGAAYESDCDKHNTAMDLGWRVYRFTPAHVEDGRALSVIQEAVKREAA